MLLLILVWMLPARRMAGGMGAAGALGRKSPPKPVDTTAGRRTTFADVAGIDEVGAEPAEVVDFLKNPQAYRGLGARMLRGVLLSGPPGNGKTLLARAVAGEADVPFFSASASEFIEMIVGVGASRAEVLVPALLRPGRLDRRITASPPDRDGREAILKIHTRSVPLSPRSDLEQVTNMARGMAGRWGMSERAGRLTAVPSDSQGAYGLSAAPATLDVVDEEARRIVAECYDDATRILTEHRGQLAALAGALLEAETLDEEAAYRAAGVPRKQLA
ncbi:ATP-dependent Zn protease [Kitasatospora sp. GP82]|nr:ATP-dependent Zn protease [Kitasatospora sp. GP82]